MHNNASPNGRLVAVVVTFNRLDKLKLALTNLLANSPSGLAHIVVVNNASTDGTAEWLAAHNDPRLDVLTSATNRGGAGGFEQGLQRALSRHKADWYVVMDDDAWPEPGMLDRFMEHHRPNDTAVAAAVYYPDGRICEMNRPSKNPFWSPSTFLSTLVKRREGYHIPPSAYTAKQPTPIDLTSFVGLFISKRMLTTAGLPDPGLFIYGDDVIYTLGLRKQGFKIEFNPLIRFTHDCSTFQDNKKRTYEPLWKVYYAYRNGLIMYHKAAGMLFWPLLPLLLLAWRQAAKRYGDNREAYERLRKAAISDGLRHRTLRSHAEVVQLAKR
ncbi:Glycosyltransferase, GT2 family [Aliiroseovarius halocynthiae]|uniref:Glycosyltransferase n=1 Tax=Aliiroseovarius halocynthiae TaxID=985055 RepID=A0A545SN82_9RHOB|nr:glycosyltransferase [Aliiroseovarius halocynthiae]TQV66438.1 glycosyltransferase [Aliiroseovarius halocynthiae]SMR83418.1 Glycosyltransferase, GT2 family [Aliiroseovarius halocynthiae]